MSIKIMELVWKSDIKQAQKMVMLCLADNANSDGVCWPSQESISIRCSASRMSVYRCIVELEKLGYISRVRRQKTTKRMSDLYQIHIEKLFDVQHENSEDSECNNLIHSSPECIKLLHPNVSNCYITYMNRHIEPSYIGEVEFEKQKKAEIPVEEIVSSYHEILPMLPKVKILTEQREKFIKSRWEERMKAGKYDSLETGIAYWKSFFQFVGLSNFLTGKSGEFIADLEWIFRPNNFAKIIENKYHREVA